MEICNVRILGLRGFNNLQEINLACSNGNPGSGLTILVGPNNSGKSTIVEALTAISCSRPPSISEGKRNKLAGDRIEIHIERLDGSYSRLKTVQEGGSQTEFEKSSSESTKFKSFVVPSRRMFAPFFGAGSLDRDSFIGNQEYRPQRGGNYSNFSSRIFQMFSNKEAFNRVLRKVLPEVPSWYIEQNDRGDHYIKFDYNGSFHNSDGTGEGLLSIFTIVDSIYDSKQNDFIVIDEPELSLHPALQRRLARLFVEYSKDRQIVIATHSPYFINWESLKNGGKIIRTVREIDGIKVYGMCQSTIEGISGLLNNRNNPHIFGLDAREVFFIEDKVILVEGQEDVVFIQRALEYLGQEINGSIFGWGVGGALNMEKILAVLQDFSYKKVAVILDGNMKNLAQKLKDSYPLYSISVIPTDDIRDKKSVPEKKAVSGLMDSGGKEVKSEHCSDFIELIRSINEYFV